MFTHIRKSPSPQRSTLLDSYQKDCLFSPNRLEAFFTSRNRHNTLILIKIISAAQKQPQRSSLCCGNKNNLKRQQGSFKTNSIKNKKTTLKLLLFFFHRAMLRLELSDPRQSKQRQYRWVRKVFVPTVH